MGPLEDTNTLGLSAHDLRDPAAIVSLPSVLLSFCISLTRHSGFLNAHSCCR